MLFHVRLDVALPHDLDAKVRDDLSARERQRVRELQQSGAWVHLWRIAGRRSSMAILDVASPEELHELLASLPLYPYLDLTVTALAAHPGDASRQGPTTVDSRG